MARSPTIALFPGTFDPITNGHLDVIRRGQDLFNRLIVAIGRNPAKPELFTMDERRQMIQKLVMDCGDEVTVETYDGLTVDYARRVGAKVILRGIRNVTDLNFEFQLALTNRAVAEIETVFIMTLIKQIASGGEIDVLHRLLPPYVLDMLKQKKIAHGGDLPWQTIDGFKE